MPRAVDGVACRAARHATPPGRSHRHLGGEGKHRAETGDEDPDQAGNHGRTFGPERIDLVQARQGRPEKRPEEGEDKGRAEACGGKPVAPPGAREEPDWPTCRLRREGAATEEQRQIPE